MITFLTVLMAAAVFTAVVVSLNYLTRRREFRKLDDTQQKIHVLVNGRLSQILDSHNKLIEENRELLKLVGKDPTTVSEMHVHPPAQETVIEGTELEAVKMVATSDHVVATDLKPK